MTKERKIGLDILRIFSMLGIIGLHVINRGGLINNADTNSISFYVILALLIFFYTSVNIFGLISGYLNIEKEKNHYKRLVELLVIVLFYCIIVTGIFYAFNLYDVQSLGKREIIHNIFPALVDRYWYITCYCFLFFMIPYINFFMKKLEKEKLKKLLIILFLLLSVLPTIFLETDFFRINKGYSPFWLLYCYMVGAYIRLYKIDIKKNKNLLYIFIGLISSFILNLFARSIVNDAFSEKDLSDWFINYISPLTLLNSCLLLILFLKIDINSNWIKKTIIWFSKASFAVYIIHAHKLIFDYILKDAFVNILQYNSIYIFFIIIATLILVYVICSIIDEIRKILFKVLNITKLIDYIGDRIDTLISI